MQDTLEAFIQAFFDCWRGILLGSLAAYVGWVAAGPAGFGTGAILGAATGSWWTESRRPAPWRFLTWAWTTIVSLALIAVVFLVLVVGPVVLVALPVLLGALYAAFFLFS